jgi:hypothetical protein
MALSAIARMMLQNVLGAGNVGAAKEIGDAIDNATPGSIATKTVITVADANALAVGPNGATNPTFDVNTATASAATGLKVTGAAAAAGVAVAALSSGTNESVTIDAKGTGTVTINGVGGTGAVQFGGAASGANATGITVTPAAAASGVAIAVVSTGGNENVTLDAKGTGTVTINGVGGTGAVQFGGAASGNNATGLKITPNAAASGVAVAVVSTGTNESMTLDAKGTGGIILGGVSTGVISLGRGSRSVLVESSLETSVSTNGALTISAAALLGGFYIHTGTTGTQTTATAAQIDALIPSPAVGDSFLCAILPTAAETLAGGTGVTIRGNASMPAGKTTLALFTRTAATPTYDVFTVCSA